MIAEREMAKELESSALIRFQDCDPFQHLNNSRYIDYFMNAREDQLNQFYDFRIFEVFQQHWSGGNHIIINCFGAQPCPARQQNQTVFWQTDLLLVLRLQFAIDWLDPFVKRYTYVADAVFGV